MKLARRHPTISSQIIADNGEVFDCTGKLECGFEVYAKPKDWDRAVRVPGTDHLLWVLTTSGNIVRLTSNKWRGLTTKV